MTFTPEEFAAQSPELQRVMIELTRLRADQDAWAKVRRLQILADCCKEEPLIQVMETDPACVLPAQPKIVEVAGDRRKSWQGYGHGGTEGFMWLSAVEEMAQREVDLPQFVWCRHRRWQVPIGDVVTKRGRHVLSLPDKRRRMR